MLQSHITPIPPSPARLGVAAAASSAAAHSPSFSQNPTNPNLNPTPKLPSSSSATAGGGSVGHPYTASTPNTISSALLPLLPPLPRAQALIPQMASLATKLYDASPHRTSWLASYRGAFPNFLNPSASVAAATSSANTAAPSTGKDILSLFAPLQAQLFEAVAELQEILDLQDSRAKLAREVKNKDATLLAFAKKIHEAQQVLDDLVDDYAGYRRDPKGSRTDGGEPTVGSDYHVALHASLDLDEILTYAHRISYTTFAPPEHGAGLAPLRGALPPAPQENEMRASQLYHFTDLDVGVPKKAALEAKDRAPVDAVSDILLEPTPPREEAPPAVPILPPVLPISVPAGWRKGMPVELPSELPPVPPGWKPGDPITLPLDGVAVGNRGEEQLRTAGVPAAAPVPVPPKALEAIQVKYVQLDINPDQDEYSSDYSSSGSSEEDDED